MATFKSDLAEGQTRKGDNRVDGRLLAGKVRQCNATITVAGTEATSDVIEVVTLPTGALINLAESYIVTEALGTTFTIGVDTTGGGALAAALDLSSAGKVDFDADGGLYTVAAGDELIVINCTSIGSPTADQTARVVITYVDYN